MASSAQNAAKKPSASARDAKSDATALLQRDHADVLKLFKEYERLADAGADERRALAEQICTMLAAHATMRKRSSIPPRARPASRTICSTKPRSSMALPRI